MVRKGLTIGVESLDALLSANAELRLTVANLQEEIKQRDRALAELQSRLNQYWDLHEDVDYRSLVDRIREDARRVAEVLRALHIGARRKLVRFGAVIQRPEEEGGVSEMRLLPSVHLLLRTLDEWK